MENLQIGCLLHVVESSVCWCDRREFQIEAGDFLMLRSTRIDEIVPGITTFEVFHPRYGSAICLTSDVEVLEHLTDLEYNN